MLYISIYRCVCVCVCVCAKDLKILKCLRSTPPTVAGPWAPQLGEHLSIRPLRMVRSILTYLATQTHMDRENGPPQDYI